MKEPENGSRHRFLKAGSMLGLAVAFSPETMIDVFADAKSKTTQTENDITQTNATQPASAQVSDKAAIRPFQFNFPDAELTDLRRRVNATKWPERESVNDASQGVQLAMIQKLARYWGTDYDWRKGEAKLKAQPHFVTEIAGLDIHFIHVRSKHENATFRDRVSRSGRGGFRLHLRLINATAYSLGVTYFGGRLVTTCLSTCSRF